MSLMKARLKVFLMCCMLRHGDRTPSVHNLRYSTDPEELDKLVEPYGYKTLTENAATKNCPAFMKEFKEMFRTFYPDMMKHKTVMDLVSESTDVGFNITERPLHIINSFDVLASQVSLGLPVGPVLKKKWRDIEKAALTAYNIMYQQKKYRSFVAGVLLNEFFKYAKKAILGKETERVRIYTAHKENVFAFSKIAKTNIDGFPNFASSFALNLRREIDYENSTERIFVEPVFSLPKLKGFVISRVFTVEGCGTRCYYDDFVELTKRHAWDYAEWRTNCHDIQEPEDNAGPIPIDEH